MSSIMKMTARRVATFSIPRASAAVTVRPFTTSLYMHKTATESAKDGLKTVDRAVSDKLIDGLDAAEAAKAKVSQTAADISNSDAAAKAQELKGEAKGKAEELKGDAKGKAEQVKGKAQELKGEAKGKAEQVKGQAKGTAEEVKGKL